MNNERFHELVLGSLEGMHEDIKMIRDQQASTQTDISLILFQIDGAGTPWTLAQIRQRITTMWLSSKIIGGLALSTIAIVVGKLIGLINWG